MNNNPHKPFIERVRTILYRIEDGILVGLLSLMIGLAVTQIFLRNLFETAIVWSDILVRVLVLWVGLVGAMVASRHGNHINIDILNRFMPERFKPAVNAVVELFTALICTLMVYYSLRFVQVEYADGGIVFANVPAWVCESIIPFALAVIAIRYFMLSIMNFKRMFTLRS
ncbi:MAG: TRAP transporter small permease [Pseudomonadota bacterium]